MIVLTILIVTLIGLILRYLVNLLLWSIRASNLTANMPGPKPWPIIGSAQYLANTKNLNDGVEKIIAIFKMFFRSPDKIFKFWLGPRLIIVMANPEHIEAVLTNEHTLTKDFMYSHIKIFSNGVVSENGKKWADLRRVILPFSSKKFIEPNLNMFQEKTKKLVKLLENKIENDKEFNLKRVIGKCTLDLMLVSNYGCDINEIDNEERPEELEESLENSMDQIFQLAVKFPTCLSATYSKMTLTGRDAIKKAENYWNLLSTIFQSRKEQGFEGKKKLYADEMIQKAETDQISWDELAKISTDYLIAGSHSVSIMSSTAILLLAMHPEHQEAVYQEQLEILGDDPDVTPTWEQLSNMTYLSRVINEVLRLFTAPLIVRYIDEDIDLGKYTIPKGSSALLSLYSMHRDPEIWSHPLEFYPDHFLPEECAKRPKNSYMPFSIGQRNCPGALYAKAVVKILVSALVRKFFFKTDLKFEEISYKYSLFMDINQGQMVKKIPRNVL